MAKLSVELQNYFFNEERSERVTLDDILALAGERAFGFFLALLSLPSALPIPAPGYSVPFGILIFLVAIQLIIGREKLWFPQKFRNSSVSLKQAQGIIKAGAPWLRRLEALSKPRFTYFCTSRAGRAVLGTAIALMGISMMIPLPLTNTFPAMGVFIIGFSLIEDDGFISIMGLTVSLIAGTLSTVMIGAYLIGGWALVETVIQHIRDFF